MKKSILLCAVLLALCSACSNDDDEKTNEGNTNVKRTLTACPNSNHPHAVDLGLPSGTKWACCNVDASSPEGYGKYFAWGEAEEKEEYSMASYQHKDDAGKYVNIGSDIAGTAYDVAQVRMGEDWQMPTHEQQIELVKYCTRYWITHNGIKGTLVVGPNGNQIFFPAAGYRHGMAIEGEGDFANYWSSTIDPKSESSACNLFANSSYWFWSYYYGARYFGLPVRAVVKEAAEPTEPTEPTAPTE